MEEAEEASDDDEGTARSVVSPAIGEGARGGEGDVCTTAGIALDIELELGCLLELALAPTCLLVVDLPRGAGSSVSSLGSAAL